MKTKINPFFVTLMVLLILIIPGQYGNLFGTNYALSLPGVSGAASNIKITGLNLNTLPYTMEMWFKPDGTQTTYAGLIYTRGTSPNNAGLQYGASWQTPGALRMMTNITGDYGTLSGAVSTGTWHQVSVVVTATSRTVYLDGVATSTENLVNPVYDFSTGDIYIGWDNAVDNRAFKGLVDEIRIWNVARTATEIQSNRYAILTGNESGLVGYWNFNDSLASHATDLTVNALPGIITGGTYVRSYPVELMTACGSLDLGDISAVTSDLTLQTTLGNLVTVNWTSSNPTVITTTGKVTQPDKYDATVKLTATLSQLDNNGVTYTLTKDFTVIVPAVNVAAAQIAEWNFTSDNILLQNDTLKVKDIQSGFIGKVMNDARIRTIGSTTQYNVLDLGNGTGYFDMGTDIGTAIYSLKNYTMMGYFRIDADYPSIASNGNFYWTFSNTADAMTDQNGYIIGSLKAESQSVATNYYATGNQAIGPTVATSAGLGTWHHMAYVQNGDTGTVYIDGSVVGTGLMTNLPYSAINIAGRTGTLYNWLGRSNYVSDVYLRKTLLYDFQLLSVPVSSDDLNLGFTGFDGVQSTLDNLNNAYAENPDYTAPELSIEMNNLTLGDLSAVKTDITLPSKGTIDPTISIIWKTTNANLITSSGMVTRPDYYNYKDTLTATLTKNGQSLVKTFPATVILKDGSQFSNNLLVKYDFSSVADSVVTDVAEKHFTGTLKNNAKVISIGSTIKYNVLSLGDSIGYFDMGTEVGKLIYNLTDYTVGAYFRIDTDYLGLSKNGNFLWNFSNSKDIANIPTGYIIASLRNQAVTISPSNYTSEQTVLLTDSASKSSWHHFAYTQSGTTGTLYVDGMPMMSDTITSLPSTTLPKSGQLGTLYNWIGRSCYASDVNLRKTLVYDFRLYKTALTDEQIQNSVLNVGSTINALDFAYQEDASAIKTVTDSRYKVISTVNEISILGLNGTEKISIFDISGRQLKMTNASSIAVNAGAYIVKIDNFVTKVIVK